MKNDQPSPHRPIFGRDGMTIPQGANANQGVDCIRTLDRSLKWPGGSKLEQSVNITENNGRVVYVDCAYFTIFYSSAKEGTHQGPPFDKRFRVGGRIR
jgi:hypothetical protein